MTRDFTARHEVDGGGGDAQAMAPGKRTLTARLAPATSAALQRREAAAAPPAAAAMDDPYGMHLVAERGVAGAGEALPHGDAIQRSFGRHDVSGVQAHTGSDAPAAIGAEAYAFGSHVAFRGAPDLHTAAHEAAHVVQQRAGVHLKGGVGLAGDVYEQHADAVADAVLAGRSAESLLDRFAGGGGGGLAVQRKEEAEVPMGKDPGTLDDAQVKEAVPFNQKLKQKVSDDAWKELDLIVSRNRPDDGTSADERFALDLAHLQKHLHCPMDGKLTPFTLRQLAALHTGAARACQGMIDEAKEKGDKRDEDLSTSTQQDLDARGGRLEELATDGAAGKAKASQAGYDPTYSDIRAEASADLRADAARGAATWVERAYVIRARCGSAVAADKLGALVSCLESNGRPAEAETVLGLVPLVNQDCVEQMRQCITRMSATAGADPASAIRFAKVMMRLVGQPFVDGSDQRTFLQKNSAAMGKAFATLDAMLGTDFGLKLTEMTLRSSFVTDHDYKQSLDGAGGLGTLSKDAASGKLMADCDVYAQYGAKLLAPQGWTLAGYLSIQGSSADDVGHVVALGKRPAKGDGKPEYVCIDSLRNTWVAPFGSFDSDEDAARALANDGITYSSATTYFVRPTSSGLLPPTATTFPPDPSHEVVRGARPGAAATTG